MLLSYTIYLFFVLTFILAVVHIYKHIRFLVLNLLLLFVSRKESIVCAEASSNVHNTASLPPPPTTSHLGMYINIEKLLGIIYVCVLYD